MMEDDEVARLHRTMQHTSFQAQHEVKVLQRIAAAGTSSRSCTFHATCSRTCWILPTPSMRRTISLTGGAWSPDGPHCDPAGDDPSVQDLHAIPS